MNPHTPNCPAYEGAGDCVPACGFWRPEPCPVHATVNGTVEEGDDVHGCTCQVTRRTGMAEAYAELNRQNRAAKEAAFLGGPERAKKIRYEAAFRLWKDETPIAGPTDDLRALWHLLRDDFKEQYVKKADIVLTVIREEG